VRIPQQVWAEGAPDVGSSGLPVAEGVVIDFDRGGGNGTIRSDDGEEVFFNFTAIPGSGYRTLRAGDAVRFEVVDNPRGHTARNVRIVT